jgi:hypothetical protein
MTLTQLLQLTEKYLQYPDLRALYYCERRWREEGQPTERWQLINFIEKMLRELKDHGGYPRVLLRRKKELQRRTFTIPEPEKNGASGECSCFDGWLVNGVTCACQKGERQKERLRKMGMNV